MAAKDNAPGKKRRGRKRRPRKNTKPEALAPRSVVDTSRPADEPLTPEERGDMRRHLAFIKRYRSVLRPKLNAKEDLLVNGSQKPEHRGICKRLLAKIDRGTITAALAREPVKSDLRARAVFLSGASAISGDLGILLLFLEALASVASQEEACRAFSRAIKRIDFKGISAARMSRLLDIMQTVFTEHNLSGTLFDLLQSRSFRTAFDGCASELKPEVAALFVPLRAVFDAVPLDEDRRGNRKRPAKQNPDLAEGLRIILSAPPTMLTAYSKNARRRLLEAALKLDADWIAEHPGIQALLLSFPAGEGILKKHGLGYAKHLIRSGSYKKALALLRDLEKKKSGGSSDVAQLIRRLGAPRVSHFTFENGDSSGKGGLQEAYSLRDLRPVLVGFGAKGKEQSIRDEVRIQQTACLPGVTDVLEHGETNGGRPWKTVDIVRPRLDLLVAKRGRVLTLTDATMIALAGVRILRALGLAGIALPDAHPRRFIAGERDDWSAILLADLTGAREVGPEEATEIAGEQAGGWATAALSFPPLTGRTPRRDLPEDQKVTIKRALDEKATPRDLASLLTSFLRLKG